MRNANPFGLILQGVDSQSMYEFQEKVTHGEARRMEGMELEEVGGVVGRPTTQNIGN